jgi:hypothetical protein
MPQKAASAIPPNAFSILLSTPPRFIRHGAHVGFDLLLAASALHRFRFHDLVIGRASISRMIWRLSSWSSTIRMRVLMPAPLAAQQSPGAANVEEFEYLAHLEAESTGDLKALAQKAQRQKHSEDNTQVEIGRKHRLQELLVLAIFG